MPVLSQCGRKLFIQMKTYKVVKLCKITGVIIAEREFNDMDEAYKFAVEVSKLGYKPCADPCAMYESEKFYINVM